MAPKWRRSLLMAVLVPVFALTGTVGALAQPALAAPTLHPFSAPTTSDSDSGCPPLYMFGVRGSRNDANDTSDTDAFINAVQNVLVAKVADLVYEMTDYPAVPILYGETKYPKNYLSSIRAGEEALQVAVGAEEEFCPGSIVAIVGYSSGAQIAGDVYLKLTSDQRKTTILAMMGYPHFNPFQGAVDYGNYNRRLWGIHPPPRTIPQADVGNVDSVCLQKDPVCNFLAVGRSGLPEASVNLPSRHVRQCGPSKWPRTVGSLPLEASLEEVRSSAAQQKARPELSFGRALLIRRKRRCN